MKQFNYNLTQINERIFALEIPNSWDRAMVFLRAQEFYESASPKFKGKSFDIWDYMRWYAVEREISTGVFDYPNDWAAYNLPINVIVKSLDRLTGEYTPYDVFMDDILHQIFNRYTVSETDTYLIGVESLADKHLSHELCHALWYTNPTFKKEASAVLTKIPSGIVNEGRATLTRMGYHKSVLTDEFVAYSATGDMKRLIKTTDSYKEFEKTLKSVLNKYLVSLKTAA
jgi:hypothetical protein